MIRVKRIDHVGIRISDVQETTAFYTDVLGLSPVPLPPRTPESVAAHQDLREKVATPAPTGGMWVEAPGTQIHMIRADKAEGVANPFGPHVAFEVEDFEEAKRALDARGLTYVEAPGGIGPFRQLFLLDPSANTVEL